MGWYLPVGRLLRRRLLRRKEIVSSGLGVGNGLDEGAIDEDENDAGDDIDEDHARPGHQVVVEYYVQPQQPILSRGNEEGIAVCCLLITLMDEK